MLDWNVMKHWPLILWLVFVILCIFLVTLLYEIFMHYILADVINIYFVITTLILGFLFFKSYTSRNMHIHHYVLSMVVVSLTCYQCDFLTMVHAIFSGIMTEGTSRWGVDPIWDYYVDTNGNYIVQGSDLRKKETIRKLK